MNAKLSNYKTLKLAFNSWLSSDAQTLVFIVKAVTAGVLALLISMTLNLPDPRTALFTVFIVMQPKSGLVLSKSFYRILGTLAGVIVSIAMIAAFAQDPVWFIAIFALWIGICTGVGVKYRNFQSYGFILAGYTVCIVALPVINTPLDVFDIAISRFSEVFVGIMCATVISDIFFPSHLSDMLFDSETQRFNAILRALSSPNTLFGEDDKDDSNLSFFASAIGLDSVRINSSFESSMDNKEMLHHQHLNVEFMHLSTTFYSLKNFISIAKKRSSKETAPFVEDVYSRFVTILAKLKQDANKENLTEASRQLITLEEKISAEIIAKQSKLAQVTTPDVLEAFEVSSNLTVRLIRELRIYCSTYLSLIKIRSSEDTHKEFVSKLKFSTHTDSVFVLLAVLRGVGLLLLSFAFWIITAWPFATQTITMAVVGGLLFGTLPNPLGVTKSFIKGALVSLFIVGIWDFYIIPLFATDILTLALIISPILAFVSWLITMPKWGGFALGFVFMFLSQCSLDPYYKITPTNFMEGGLAAIIGLIFAGAAYVIADYFAVILAKQRVAKVLSDKLISLCSDKKALQRAALESTGRDLLQQFSTHGKLDISPKSPIFMWLISTLEIGSAIVNIKKEVTALTNSGKAMEIGTILQSIGVFFSTPSKDKLQKLLLNLGELRMTFADNSSMAMNYELRAVQNISTQMAIIRTTLSSADTIPIIKEI